MGGVFRNLVALVTLLGFVVGLLTWGVVGGEGAKEAGYTCARLNVTHNPPKPGRGVPCEDVIKGGVRLEVLCKVGYHHPPHQRLLCVADELDPRDEFVSRDPIRELHFRKRSDSQSLCIAEVRRRLVSSAAQRAIASITRLDVPYGPLDNLTLSRILGRRGMIGSAGQKYVWSDTSGDNRTARAEVIVAATSATARLFYRSERQRLSSENGSLRMVADPDMVVAIWSGVPKHAGTPDYWLVARRKNLVLIATSGTESVAALPRNALVEFARVALGAASTSPRCRSDRVS